MVALASALTAETATEVRALAATAEVADEVAPLSEAFLLGLGHTDGTVHVLDRGRDGDLTAYAQVRPDRSAELLTHPDHRRRGHGRHLLEAVRGAGARRVWAHGTLPAAVAFAEATGLVPVRSLQLMVRATTGADAAPVGLPDGYTVRPFEPGADDQAWLALNAAAFAGHAEQGRLTLADLQERRAQPWFDPGGLLLVDAPDGTLAASHWTKVEPGHPDVGEVYVVGIHPEHQGRGLGGPVTRLGLAHLARRGVREVRLYADGDNAPALATYARLGFTVAAVDTMYAVAP